MPTIEDDPWIDAPIDGVFEYLASLGNHVDAKSSFVEGIQEGGPPKEGTGVSSRDLRLA